MRPIAPRTGAPEITVAEEQEQYMPITVANYILDGVPVRLLRYTFTEAERHALRDGEDVYIALLGGGPMTPIMAQVGPKGWT